MDANGCLEVSREPTHGVCETDVIPGRGVADAQFCMETGHVEGLGNSLPVGICEP